MKRISFWNILNCGSKQFVLDLLNRLKSEVTIIFISHRLHSLPRIADTIYVLEEITIADHGSHEALMASENFYSDFWKEMHLFQNAS